MRNVVMPFSKNSMTVLCKRYLLPKIDDRKPCEFCGKKHETVEELFGRCSFGNDDFYNLLGSRDFLPNSPTLFNAGTGQGTFSGCFKFDVEDSMVSIMDVATKSAFVQKWGGGVGYAYSALRAFGEPIRTTHGKACGPIAVLAVDHAISKMITQGGKRAGAQMGILHCDHLDIEQFIHCKDVPSECTCSNCKTVETCDFSRTKAFDTFNISVACTDKFMEESETPGTRAYRIFEQIVDGAWRRGDPGVYFIDTAEKANPTPWLGKLTGTNPCGEVPLLNNEPCNLGSINLGHMIKDGQVDWERLKYVTRLATCYLDIVLDNNAFPDQHIADMAQLTRKLGLGVMGWADMLAIMHIHYDTDKAVQLAKEVMSKIQEWSHDESYKLADEKGMCPAFASKVVTDSVRNQHYMRNATTTCIAPAGTICTIANCSSGIEPHFTLEGVRRMGDGTRLTESVRVDTGGFIPHTTLEINGIWQIKHQAAFQEFTDLAVSKTVNLSNNATRDQVREVYKTAWELGCKGVTVYRNGSRNVQVVDIEPKQADVQFYPTDAKFGVHRHKMPKTGMAERHDFKVGDTEAYLHTGYLAEFLPTKVPGEIFITGANQGSTVSGLLAALSIVTSLALQYGTPLETLVSKLEHIRFEPSGMTDNPDIPTSPSIVAYVFRYLSKRFLNGHRESVTPTGMTCPDCGASAISEEGCLKCSKGCGWSRCG